MNQSVAETTARESLLLVEDDHTLASSLARALYYRNFEVTIAHNGDEALRAIEEDHPRFAVLDLKIPGSSALALLPKLCGGGHATRAVVVTGYASIATAVAATKLGALDYLPKPVDPDAIVAALRGETDEQDSPAPGRPLTTDRLEWEHLQRVLAEHGGNVTATARALRMHRRSLQRKLQKRSPSPD
jgi:two-component system, response regulator RegA